MIVQIEEGEEEKAMKKNGRRVAGKLRGKRILALVMALILTLSSDAVSNAAFASQQDVSALDAGESADTQILDDSSGDSPDSPKDENPKSPDADGGEGADNSSDAEKKEDADLDDDADQGGDNEDSDDLNTPGADGGQENPGADGGQENPGADGDQENPGADGDQDTPDKMDDKDAEAPGQDKGSEDKDPAEEGRGDDVTGDNAVIDPLAPKPADTEQESVILENMSEIMAAAPLAEDTADGTLQNQISASESETVEITLDQDYEENLVIPDGKTVTIDLNGHTIRAVREDSEDSGEKKTLSMITVYGTLTLEGDEKGCIMGEGLENIRAITVASGGSFTLAGGKITGFQVSGNGGGVRVEENGHFTMKGGTIQGNEASEGYGGGVFAYSSEGLELTSGLIRENKADFGGGVALNLMEEEAPELLENIEISENTAVQYGGGLYLANAGTLVLNNVTMKGNTAPSGGGIWLDAATNASLNACILEENKATTGSGGGIGSASAVTLEISGGRLAGNTAEEGNGGAVYLEVCGSTLHIMNHCEISGNSAKTYGGGIALVNKGGKSTSPVTLAIEDSVIADNRLTGTANGLYGGGIMTGHYAKVTINRSEILRNSGATHGGGLFVWDNADAELTETTFSQNTIHTIVSGSYGGGIYKGTNGTMLIKDCTVTKNGDSTVLEDDADPLVDDSDSDGTRANADETDAHAYGLDPLIRGGGIYISGTGGTTMIAGNTLISHNKAGYGGGIGGGKVILQDTEETEMVLGGGSVRVEHNYAMVNGGGILGGNVTLRGHVKVRRNTAENAGGGIQEGTVYLYDEAGVVNNKTITGEGGGIYAKVVMEGGYIRGNYAASNGGGIRTSNLTMTGGEISNNTTKGSGGGIWYWYNGTIDITGGSIIGNEAGGNGGGINVGDHVSGKKLYEHTFGDVVIQGNYAAGSGGGIYLGSWTKLNLERVTLTGNQAAGSGGGLYTGSGYKEVHFTDCAVFDNQAGSKGRDILVGGGHAISDSSPYALHHFAWLDLPEASEMAGSGENSAWMDENQKAMVEGAPNNLAQIEEVEKDSVYNADTGWTGCTTENFPDIALTFVPDAREAVAEMNGAEYPGVQAAVNALAQAGTKEQTVIRLLQESREDVVIPEGVNVVLDLDGNILRGLISSVIRVKPGAELTIRDGSETTEGTIQDGRGTSSRYNAAEKLYGGGLFIEGTVTLESGTIQNNTADYGSAVYVCDGGEFHMTGGRITGNRGGDAAVYVYRIEQNEKGSAGAALFHMTGGEISNNTNRGVVVDGRSEFTMTGGEIKEHSSGALGAGVYLRQYAHFTMKGGRIADNTTTNGTGAAGIYVESYGQLDLQGGEITGNKNTNLDGRGAGIYYNPNNTTAYLNLTGTKVYGNLSGTREQEIYLCSNANVRYLWAASEMTGSEEDCWYDDINRVELTEALEKREPLARSLSVARRGEEHTDAVRIGETPYPSISEAVKAAQDGDVIYLLRDVTESVALTDTTAEKKQIIIDLNGFNLSPDAGYVFRLQGIKLCLQNTREQEDSNKKTDGGKILPLEDGRASRAIYVYNGSETDLKQRTNLTIEDITFRGFTGAAEGGAICVIGAADVVLTDCRIEDCSATGNGGGLLIRPNNSGWKTPYSLKITGGAITGNTSGNQGGGIYAGAGDAEHVVEITGTRFENNTAAKYDGGGFYFGDGNRTNENTHVTLKDVIFCKNHAKRYGGGAAISAVKQADLEGVRFEENDAASAGGGLYLWNNKNYGQKTAIKNCTFSNNISQKGSGGGAYLGFNDNAISEVDISGSIFAGNKTEHPYTGGVGGGLYSIWTVLRMDGCQVADNHARTAGGAYVNCNTTDISSVISNCTFDGNSTVQNEYGGGLYLKYRVDVKNSEVKNNTAYYGGGVYAEYHKGVLENVNLHDNQGYVGAAIHFRNYSGGSDNPDAANYYWTEVKGCEIKKNICLNLDRAALTVQDACHHVRISGLESETESGSVWKKTEISDNAGRGIYIEGKWNNWSGLELLNGTEIAGNRSGSGSGAGIYALLTNITIEDGVSVRENISDGDGGGLYMSCSVLNMTGGTFSGNRANNGGAIRVYGNRYMTTDVPCTTVLNLSGGTMEGNTAVQNGGAIYGLAQETNIYGKDPWVLVNLTGGMITGNTAGGQGGGVYVRYNNTFLSLKEHAKVYGNKASLGQDIYGAYAATHRSTRLELMKASDMFEEGFSRKGVAWLDEARNSYIEGEIKTTLSRYYALTLISEMDQKVAYAGTSPFTSVQAAVDYALQYPEECVLSEQTGAKEQKPVVTLAQNVSENVLIPAGFDGVLNLNGYTLRGFTTALDCYGTLRIRDDKSLLNSLKEAGVTRGGNAGTITGSAPEYGGGIRVRSGGYAVLESGQISGCRAAVNYNSASYGGAAVCVDAGTFELTGEGRITGNTSHRGAAVYVRNGSSKFLMTGGEITDNQATSYGVIYNYGGTIQINGGKISDNTANQGGAVFNNSGTLRIAGGESHVQITGNTAVSRGGAIYQNGGTITLSNVSLENNKVTGAKTGDVTQAAGGAIYQNSGTLTIGDGTRFVANSAVRGGAIYQYSSSAVIRMLGGYMMKNRAQMGGGVAQYPEANSRFQMVRGSVYDNISTLSGAGNDFYSAYEGSSTEYGPTYGTKVPELTLPAAISMGDRYYNVWKDDSYKGTERTGVKIGSGQYLTSGLVTVYNVQLTADHYKVDAVLDLSSDMKVSGVSLAKQDSAGGSLATNGMVDGYAVWDQSGQMEKSAKQMMAEEPDSYTESEQSYLFNGEAFPYIQGPDGRLYEQDQMVTWSPGDDSNGSNTLIRTFDKVTYSVQTALVADNASKEGSDSSQEDSIIARIGKAIAGLFQADGTKSDSLSETEEDTEDEDKTKTVHIWAEMKLPCGEDQASFITGSLRMDAYSITPVTENGEEVQYLRGYWEKEVKNSGGLYTENIEIQINGARNGDTIKPAFKAWVEGNETNEKEPAECASKILTVSANSASRYNVSIDYNNTLSYTSYFNLDTGEEASREEMEEGNSHIVYGTMLGYGLIVELYNQNGKGLKGIETSADSVEFDLSLKGGLFIDGKEVIGADGSPVRNAPYIWAYKENIKSDSGIKLNGTNYDQNMDWNDEDDLVKTTNYAYNAAPFNSGGGSQSCYSGGSWSITGEHPTSESKETTVHVKVSGFNFDYSSGGDPIYNSDGSRNPILAAGSVKAFSAGYVQVVYPLDERDVAGNSGFLSIAMKAAVSRFGTGDTAEPDTKYQSDDDLKAMADYYGISVEELKTTGYAVNEPFYSDNCSSESFGMYIMNGGDGDALNKNNYFMTENRAVISKENGARGDGNTPLNSVVYISGKAAYSSKSIRTDTPDDPLHYIPDDEFDTEKNNKIEYNYMTALNILQKFDARAYTPVGTEAIVGRHYKFSSGSPTSDQAFWIISDETAASWSSTATMECDLTILYAAKPDGENWEVGDDPDHEIAADMDQYREENLLYFETMDDLKSYFSQRGKDDAKCVAVLYEFRNACIRSGRSITASCRMQVTDDFNYTGGTYCTTNDMRCWATYRPLYKEYYEDTEKSLDDLLYQFRWEGMPAEDQENTGVKVYGAALPAGIVYSGDGQTVQKEAAGYDAYFETDRGSTADRRMLRASYWNGYIPSKYEHGNFVTSTHNGWYSGNTLLLYTLDTSIVHTTADVVQGSNGKLKTSYDIAQGERLVNFMITPSVNASSSVTDHELVTNGSQKAAVTIELTLPKGLTYNPQSVRFDYSGSSCKYKDGELQWEIEQSPEGNKLYLKTVITDISKGLPRISYSCKIGDENDVNNDVKSGTSLTATASIYAEYQEVHRLASESHTSSAQIQILKSSSNGVWLDVDHILTEIGDELAYNLHFTNNAATKASDIQFCDVLPYVGDGRGTNFQGGYQVTGVRVKFNNQKDYEAFIAETESLLKSASGKKVPATNSEQADLLEAVRDKGNAAVLTSHDPDTWTIEYTPENLKQLATDSSGIALYGRIPSVSEGSSFTVTIRMSPRDPGASEGELLKDTKNRTQKGADIYQNNFFYVQGMTSRNPVYSNQHHIQAVGRTVSGMVWMDQNHDGDRVSTEAVLSGINVVLMKQGNNGWEQALDLLGNEMKAETGADGTYMFENLPEGTYTVWFHDENDNYAMVKDQKTSKPLGFGQLSVTSLGENMSNRAAGSYMGEDTPGKLASLDYAHLDTDLVLPRLELIQSAQYSKANQDCGLYYTDLTLVKRWADLLGAVENGMSVTLRVNRNCGDQELDVMEYTLTQTGSNVTATATGAATPEVKVESQGISPYVCTWTMEHIALQAEGKEGPVQYTFSEIGSILGYKKTEETRINPNTGCMTFTAENRQILYSILITKVKNGTADELKGAGFGVYSDTECKTLIQSKDSGDTSVTSFLNLPAGTYYLRETKAPAGYALNDATFKAVISYDTENDTSSVTVTQISDEITGEILETERPVSATIKEGTGSEYVISFQVEDEVLFSLPSTGGDGTMPYRIAGLMILLISAGLWGYDQRRRRRGEVA